MNLKDRVVIVTGAGTGIGRAVAEHFGKAEARVVVNYRESREAAEEAVATIQATGGTAVAIAADVSKQSGAKQLMEETVRQFGRIDCLVNNAGWSTRVPHHQLDDLTDEIWERTMNTNLRGAFYCVRAAVPHLKSSPALPSSMSPRSRL